MLEHKFGSILTGASEEENFWRNLCDLPKNWRGRPFWQTSCHVIRMTSTISHSFPCLMLKPKFVNILTGRSGEDDFGRNLRDRNFDTLLVMWSEWPPQFNIRTMSECCKQNLVAFRLVDLKKKKFTKSCDRNELYNPHYQWGAERCCQISAGAAQRVGRRSQNRRWTDGQCIVTIPYLKFQFQRS